MGGGCGCGSDRCARPASGTGASVRVTVQLFARLRELAGRQEWVCELPSGASAAELWQEIGAVHPGIAEFAPTVSCAINADFAPMNTELHDGDEVAFLPPVSGGSASRLS